MACTTGSHCAQGATVALPCEVGSFSNQTNRESQQQCDECGPGSFCVSGSVAPAACPAGTYGAESNLSSAQCSGPCAAGYFCPESSISPTQQQCPAGTFNGALGGTSVDACQPCGKGSYCEAGSIAPTQCPAGRFGSSDRLSDATCTGECEQGYFCEAGSVSGKAAPCAEGSYGSATGLQSQPNCTACPAGSACSTGATAPKACSPGSAANASGLGSCVSCARGEYQDATSAMACKVCTAAHFCAVEGGSAATPCPGGTWSDRTGLKAEAQCIKVVKGQWAPTGSSAPEPCPASGFYCPGYDAVQEHLAQNITPPGSKPILVDSGAARETRNVTVVTFGLTLEGDITAYDEDATRTTLSELYDNVPAASIALTVVSGSVQLLVTITPADESSAEVDRLTGAIEATTPAQLAGAFGSTATITAVRAVPIERDFETTCPRGAWCSAALTIPCTANTYNNKTQQISQGACTPCPDFALSPAASESVSACYCRPGYYGRAPIGTDAPDCTICPVGSDCAGRFPEGGVTIVSLPLLVGYYRASNASDDLRRCPDFGNSSGCVGGVAVGSGDGDGDGDGAGPCKPWLTGPYCKLCNVSDTSRYYDTESSECAACAGDAVVPLAVGGGVAAAVLLLLVLLLVRLKRRKRKKWGVLRRAELLTEQLSLRAKGKLLFSFYQVATRIGSVYEVALPDAVRSLLALFEVLNLNLAGVPGVPLQCLNLGSYEQQLLFTVLAPLVLAAAILAFFVLQSCVGRKGACVGTRGAAKRCALPMWLSSALIAALPYELALSFLVFPMVSSAAFRAFSCDDFDTGRSYLRADYAVECGTDAHDAAQSLAWMGIGFYPVGISLLYVALLAKARPALLANKPTPLSTALGFLVRDYTADYYWWEMLEMWKKLLLVGFAVLVQPDSTYQIVSAYLVSLVYLLLAAVAAPFKAADDSFFAKAANFALSALFFFCVVLKMVRRVLWSSSPPPLADQPAAPQLCSTAHSATHTTHSRPTPPFPPENRACSPRPSTPSCRRGCAAASASTPGSSPSAWSRRSSARWRSRRRWRRSSFARRRAAPSSRTAPRGCRPTCPCAATTRGTCSYRTSGAPVRTRSPPSSGS